LKIIGEFCGSTVLSFAGVRPAFSWLSNHCIPDVLTSDLMFSEKFKMSDILATNPMLTGLLFLFTTFLLILAKTR